MRQDATFDCEREAEAAMKMAAAARGVERMKWVRAALAWYDLARGNSGRQGGEWAVAAAHLLPHGNLEG